MQNLISYKQPRGLFQQRT